MDSRPRAEAVASAAALLTLFALALLSVWSVQPPRPRGPDVPVAQFSAARAIAHVERVGAEVHVTGGEAADQVRGYLESTLRDLGLQPEIQDAVGATADEEGGLAMARVRNVVALLTGTASTGRVIMVAHYDSVQVSYGGNDDGAGVATLLEATRALLQGGRHRNDIVLLFTDAEEACLCGAEAFISQHRFGADGGLVLNVESRGSAGPAIMFETSPGNAGVVGVYGGAVPHPVATSFAVEVYRILPNDTDFTPFLEARRFTGLNTAYIDGSAAYHTPLDTPANVDQASLQHLGDNTLAAARAFADADLRDLVRPAGGDLTYFPVLTLLVRYPGWLVWPLALLAAAAVGALAWAARRRGLTSWPRLAAGLGAGLVPLLSAALAGQLLWLVLVAIRPGYANMIDPWRPGWYRLGVLALVGFALVTRYSLERRRLRPWSLAIGALALLALLGVVLAALTPGGSYLATLPALAGALAGLGALAASGPVVRVVVLAAGAAVAVLILAPTVLLFLPALGLATGGAPAFVAALLGLALLPVLEWIFPGPPLPLTAARRWRTAAPGALAGVVALASVATGLAVDRFDAGHPVPSQLMYALDADTGRARWVSTEPSPGQWTVRFVTGREDLGATFPVLGDDLATGEAQPATLPPPEISVVADTMDAGQRALTFTLTPRRPVRLAYLRVEGETEVVRATVAGRELTAAQVAAAGTGDGRQFAILFHAPPPEGITVTLVLSRSEPVRIRAMDGSDGLAGLPGFQPRPPGVGIRGSHLSELVLVARTYQL